MRKASGLRNRYRSGRGSYSRGNKAKVADHYGKFVAGRRVEDDRIAKRLRAVDTEPEVS